MIPTWQKRKQNPESHTESGRLMSHRGSSLKESPLTEPALIEPLLYARRTFVIASHIDPAM